MGWRKEPAEVTLVRTLPKTEEIHLVDPDNPHWQLMAGRIPDMKANEQWPPEFHNRFATLLEGEAIMDQ